MSTMMMVRQQIDSVVNRGILTPETTYEYTSGGCGCEGGCVEASSGGRGGAGGRPGSSG